MQAGRAGPGGAGAEAGAGSRALCCPRRYELPAPSSGQKNDITAWQECVNNSMAQLEHQAVRIENLELMSQHGCNAWKVYNEYVGLSYRQPSVQRPRRLLRRLLHRSNGGFLVVA